MLALGSFGAGQSPPLAVTGAPGHAHTVRSRSITRGAQEPGTLYLPKISSARVGVAIRFRRGPDELVALLGSARCGMMIGCAVPTGLPGCDECVRVTRLLPASARDKDVEILVLRHQITVLERQLGTDRLRFSPADRAFLAALLHRLPRDVLGRFRLLIRPDTVLGWHRNLLARRQAARSWPRRPGRPRTVRSIRLLVLRLARENPCWGYRRIHGELLVLGIKTAPSTVWEILHDAGIDPAPGRASTTWADFLRSQADAVLACGFSETVTVTGVHLFVLAVIEHARRRIRVLGATAHPTVSWVVQAARNLVMDLEDAGSRARFLIRDRDGKFPGLFDTVLKDAGIEVVLSGVQMPRMNALMERWVQTCRRELLDRTLIWNQAHLLHALREFEQFYNPYRPHQGISNARPLRALPSPIPGLDATTRLHVHRHDHLGGILHEYRHAALPARIRFSASTAPALGLSRIDCCGPICPERNMI
jgi:putative transposase